jgi:hypothetical protein
MRADYIPNEDKMADMRKDAGEGGGEREEIEERKKGRWEELKRKQKRPVKINAPETDLKDSPALLILRNPEPRSQGDYT